MEFKYALKLISTAQFFSLKRTGSYQQHDGEFLADFLYQEVRVPSEPNIDSINFSDDQEGVAELGQAERDSLYKRGRILCTKCNEK